MTTTNVLNIPDVLREIAYKLRAEDIIALCRSGKKLYLNLCNNEYFLKQVYLKYLKYAPEAGACSNRVISRILFEAPFYYNYMNTIIYSTWKIILRFPKKIY